MLHDFGFRRFLLCLMLFAICAVLIACAGESLDGIERRVDSLEAGSLPTRPAPSPSSTATETTDETEAFDTDTPARTPVKIEAALDSANATTGTATPQPTDAATATLSPANTVLPMNIEPTEPSSATPVPPFATATSAPPAPAPTVTPVSTRTATPTATSTRAPTATATATPKPASAMLDGEPAPTTFLTIGDATGQAGHSAQVVLQIDGSGDGVAGFIIDISVSDPAIAAISAVTLPAYGLTFSPEAADLPAAIVRVTAIDLLDVLSGRLEDETLMTLTLDLLATGSTELVASIEALDDDDGSDLDPLTVVADGQITVLESP